MKVDEELKRKRAELLGEVEEFTARIQAINGQISAIDQVIAIYDPAYALLGTAAPKPPRPKAAKQLPPEFARINKNEAILEVLREAEQPLSTADCTSRIAERNGADADDPSMPRFLTQVSAALIESRPRKFEQVDKWNFCLTTAIIAVNRRDHEQTTAPEPHSGLQGEGGACRRQG